MREQINLSSICVWRQSSVAFNDSLFPCPSWPITQLVSRVVIVVTALCVWLTVLYLHFVLISSCFNMSSTWTPFKRGASTHLHYTKLIFPFGVSVFVDERGNLAGSLLLFHLEFSLVGDSDIKTRKLSLSLWLMWIKPRKDSLTPTISSSNHLPCPWLYSLSVLLLTIDNEGQITYICEEHSFLTLSEDGLSDFNRIVLSGASSLKRRPGHVPYLSYFT